METNFELGYIDSIHKQNYMTVEPGRNPLLSSGSTPSSGPGKKPDSFASKVTSSDTYGKVKSGASVAWDKTKSVSVAAAHAAKPAAVATKNAAVSLFDKAKNAVSRK
jgi:hypothetical protein